MVQKVYQLKHDKHFFPIQMELLFNTRMNYSKSFQGPHIQQGDINHYSQQQPVVPSFRSTGK